MSDSKARMTARAMPYTLRCLVAAAFLLGCGRDRRAAPHSNVEPQAAPSSRGSCDHAACGDQFFIDVVPGAGCAAGTTCSVAIRLVATGDYHINDEYPYKFKADEAPDVEFLGTDSAGKNVFSKAGGSWAKNDARTGTMSVAFKASDAGIKRVGGTFKFSVCSPQNCELEQRQVNATVQAGR
jgi:hypothetical protein